MKITQNVDCTDNFKAHETIVDFDENNNKDLNNESNNKNEDKNHIKVNR